MSQDHYADMLNASIVRKDEGLDEAIRYRNQVLHALEVDHPLFKRTLQDLTRLLFDSRKLEAVLTGLNTKYANDVTSTKTINQLISATFVEELKSIGLLWVDSIRSPPLNPRADSYISRSPSSENSQEVNIMLSPPKTPIFNDKGKDPSHRWGYQNVCISGLPVNMKSPQVDLEIDKFKGNLLNYDAAGRIAIASFPAVTASDIVSAGAIVLGDMAYKAEAFNGEGPKSESKKIKTTVAARTKAHWESNGGQEQQMAYPVTTAAEANGRAGDEVQELLTPAATKQELSIAKPVPQKPRPATNGDRRNSTSDQAEHSSPKAVTNGHHHDAAVGNGTDPHVIDDLTAAKDLVADQPGGVDLKWTDWIKARKNRKFLGQYGGPEPVSPTQDEVNANGVKKHPAETIGSWGYDGTMSPIMMTERGLINDADMSYDNVFALYNAYPWNEGGIARALTRIYGKNSFALFKAPQDPRLFGFDDKINYYLHFCTSRVPVKKEQNICLVPRAGEGGEGWMARLKPVKRIDSDASIVTEPGLLGKMVYEFDLME